MFLFPKKLLIIQVAWTCEDGRALDTKGSLLILGITIKDDQEFNPPRYWGHEPGYTVCKPGFFMEETNEQERSSL